VASHHPPPLFVESKLKKKAEIKAKSLARCLIVEIARLVCPVFKQFSIKSQFSDFNILGTCPIDSATPR